MSTMFFRIWPIICCLLYAALLFETSHFTKDNYFYLSQSTGRAIAAQRQISIKDELSYTTSEISWRSPIWIADVLNYFGARFICSEKVEYCNKGAFFIRGSLILIGAISLLLYLILLTPKENKMGVVLGMILAFFAAKGKIGLGVELWALAIVPVLLLLSKLFTRGLFCLLLLFLGGLLLPGAIDYFIESLTILSTGEFELAKFFHWRSPDLQKDLVLTLFITILPCLLAAKDKPLYWSRALMLCFSFVTFSFHSYGRFIFCLVLIYEIANWQFLKLKQMSSRLFFDRWSNNDTIVFVLGSLFVFFFSMYLRPVPTLGDFRVLELLPAIDSYRNNIESKGLELKVFHELKLADSLQRAGIKTFIDQRFSMFSQKGLVTTATDSVLQDYWELVSLGKNWESVLKHWGVNALILEKRNSLTQMLLERNTWQELAVSSEAACIDSPLNKTSSLVVLVPNTNY